MYIHGQPDFSVLANPVLTVDNNSSVSILYDTFASFEEGSTVYNYTLVDGIAFTSHSSFGVSNPLVTCADSSPVPSINSIVSALSGTTPVARLSTSSGGVIECSSSSAFKLSVNNVDFGLCALGPSGLTMFGSDVDITVEYLTNRVDIVAPAVNVSTGHGCKAVASPSSLSSREKSLLTGETNFFDSARMLKAEFDFSLGESCSCKSTPRPCIFIHGLGIRKEEPTNTDKRPRYWGDLTGHAPCCSSMKFAVLDTIKYSWTDDSQQQKVCDRALAVSNTSHGTTISDTIIVTHSMGGLMLAGAIATGKCSLASSATWVSSAAPMTGSMSSDYFQDSCKDDTNFFMETFVDLTGLCPPGDGIQSLAYENETYSTPELNEAYAVARETYRTNVSALMCSKGHAGIYSIQYVQYRVLGNIVPHKSDQNDGLVEFQSCAAGISESKFGNTYRDRFYATELNHGDAAFRHGDSLVNEAKMPVKWFECLL
ncbi:hypothetical protein PF005_g24614 [Phytophthora fragariae]|uniref:Uncharacterized protein n=3 Tax=Phytophthora fragariae TaxID=53985 RepID=A0A6A3W1C1_9STRA|nr:hypothetical protein PF005_g24614 [Phytophthora fragariae]